MRDVLDAFLRPASIGIVALACVYGVVIVLYFRKLRSARQDELTLACSPLLVITGTLTLAVIVSHILGSPFWGRHLAALMPFIVFAVAVALRDSPNTYGSAPPLAWLLAMLLLTSSLVVRCDVSHGRDDYRRAARIARAEAAGGRTVWWGADPGCAEYYGVSFCGKKASDEKTTCIVYVSNQPSYYLLDMPTPELVVVSKPDLHDRDGELRGYLDSQGYRVTNKLVAFRIYEKPLD
jgi:hypothetical protein